MSNDEIPSWVAFARVGWTWRGSVRPPFAVQPKPGQESVWDYPRPPLLVPDDREVVVRLGEVELARTRRAYRVLETSHPPAFYLPREDVVMHHLLPAGGGSFCEWKGPASYFDVSVNLSLLPKQAWSYQAPFETAEVIRDAIAFYATQLDCFVNGQRVQPQPGGFYGGWITPELVGPFKGEPGTSGW